MFPLSGLDTGLRCTRFVITGEVGTVRVIDSEVGDPCSDHYVGTFYPTVYTEWGLEVGPPGWFVFVPPERRPTHRVPDPTRVALVRVEEGSGGSGATEGWRDRKPFRVRRSRTLVSGTTAYLP